MSMELSYTVFKSIQTFLERLACLKQPEVTVVDSRPDFIHVELRGVPFGREVSTEKNVDGDKLYDFIAHNLLPQCNVSPDCYELKEESRCLVLMRTHGRTIKFFMTTEYIPIDEECSTYFNNLQVSFKLEPDEYGQFLDMINRG